MSSIASAPVTTGSYSAAVLDLLGAPSDAQVAIRAVNGQAIAPASVASTGGVSGTIGTFSSYIQSNELVSTIGYQTLPDASGAGYGSRLTSQFDGSSGYALVLQTRKNTGIWSSRFFIMPDTGNVAVGGPGTAAVDSFSALQVYGASTIPSNNSPILALKNAANSAQLVQIGYDATLGTNGAGHISAVHVGITWTPLLLNPNSGNVGVGTVSPSERLDVAGNIKAAGVIRPGAYTVAEANALTAAAAGAGAGIYVTNETGGAVPAFSDGTDWRRGTDRAVIS